MVVFDFSEQDTHKLGDWEFFENLYEYYFVVFKQKILYFS